MDNKQLEEYLDRKGLNAARVTLSDIEDTVVSAEYHVFNGVLTVCCLTLKNGFTVTGESACVSESNFDKEIGERLAYAQAFDQIWCLEGYLLRQKIHEEVTQ